MDNLALTQADLIKYLLANLPTGYTAATVKIPNAKFTTPKNTKWLHATVIPFDSESDAATGEYKITRGLFVVNVNYPKGVGDIDQQIDAQALKVSFGNTEFGNTQTQTVSVLTIGESDSWYTIQVNINFYMAGFSQ